MIATERFEGFPESGLRFLTSLKKNNTREWFNERKQTYLDDVQAPLHALVTAVNDALKKKKLPIASDPRRLSFRIYRDTRFSSDKSPYKTHASAVLYRHGNRATPGILYMHIDPAEPFLAAGYHMPDSPHLRALREGIADEPAAWLALVKKLERAGVVFGDGEPLSRLPRGFENADERIAPWIKRKSFTVHATLSRADLLSAELPDRVVSFAATSMPLLEWGWEIFGTE